MAEYRLQTPITEDAVRELKAGDMVYFTGSMFYVGVSAIGGQSSLIAEAAKKGEKLPFDLKGCAVVSGYGHFWGEARELGGTARASHFGFSTISRLNPEVPHLIQHVGIRAIMGKGGIGDPYMPGGQDTSEEILALMAHHGCVAITGVGGCAISYGTYLREIIEFWKEKGPNARVIDYRVQDIGPLLVTMDTHGNSYAADIKKEIKRKLPEAYRRLNL